MSKKLVKLLIILIPLVFFMTFCFIDGYVICEDSASYIEMNQMREPLYPLVIELFRTLIKNDNYLLGVVIFQSLLMSFATTSLVLYLDSEFKQKDYISFLELFLIIFVSLLCRFASRRGSMYSNSILSEGIAYPLFLLFIRYCFDYLINKKNKVLILLGFISFLMISTRKQMYISLFLLAFTIIYLMISTKTFKKYLLCLVIVCVSVIGLNRIFDTAYMKIFHNVEGTHTSDNRFISAMIFYVSEESDADYIKDQEIKELFLDIYKACDKNSYLGHSAGDGWYNKVSHFGDNFDYVQIDTMWKMEKEYAALKTNGNIDQLVDDYNSVIITSLLPKTFTRLFTVFFNSFLYGLVIAVSADKEFLIVPSILIYLGYIVVLIMNIRKEGLNKEVIFGLFVMLSILLNDGVVSLTVFNQTRYTIYNMALFYIAGLLMLYNLIGKKKEINY